MEFSGTDIIDLFAAPTTNGLRTKIMLDECALPYTLHPVDIRSSENKQDWFVEMNPDGLAPVLIDRDGPGGEPVTLSQSIAILIYLAEKTGLFVPDEPRQRAEFWSLLMNAATDVAPAVVGIFLIQRRSEGPDNGPALKVFEDRFRDFMSVWDQRLATGKWCAGNEVTIADFALYPVFVRCRDVVPEITAGLANVDRWCADMAKRPGVMKGMTFA